MILSLETATLGGSVCLVRDDRVMASRIGDPKTSHSNSLLRDINDLLEEAGVAIEDVDLFAAAVGPGSFTGLRIGLATIKGLATTLGKRCVGVPTLEAVALAAGESEATVALLPAGRGEVFAQLHSVSSEGDVRPLDKASHIPPQRVFALYDALTKITWAGEGARLHQELIKEQARVSARDAASWTIAPVELNLAKYVATLALRLYLSNKSIEPELLNAIYVRPSDAELNANVVNN